MKKIIILLFITAFIFLSFAYKNEMNASNKSFDLKNDTFYCKAKDFPKQDISISEEKKLRYMRSEEKLAHDFYSMMFDKWGLRPFNNIKGAEERHMAAIKSMLDKYSIDDPEKNYQVGVISNSNIKTIYDELLVKGNLTELDALKAGAEIEELDIKDLIEAINDTDNNDIKFVYSNLKRGSENHLRAFMRNISRRGGNYSPKHLDKNSFNEILEN